ncbi:MAG: coproporphyrinogen III oxidase, partial [Planctomycetota bacterium]
LAYWTNANWWAIGPSASGHLNGLRWKNVPRLGTYLDHGPWPRITDVEYVDASARVGERLMLGLRIRRGVQRCDLDAWRAEDADHERRDAVIARALDDGHLSWTGDHLHLTDTGIMLADSILASLI